MYFNCKVLKIQWTILKSRCHQVDFLNPFLFTNERTEMKLKICLSEAWMCSEFGMLITDVERERVNVFCCQTSACDGKWRTVHIAKQQGDECC